MNGKRNLIVGVIGVTLSIAGISSALAEVGRVKPCSLVGVNPVHHPEIFGDANVALEHYGFVQGANGKWQVEKGCRKHGHHAALSVPSFLQALAQ